MQRYLPEPRRTTDHEKADCCYRPLARAPLAAFAQGTPAPAPAAKPAEPPKADAKKEEPKKDEAKKDEGKKDEAKAGDATKAGDKTSKKGGHKKPAPAPAPTK